ncbi:hypothetical protein [Haliangium sp.]|uniref:hypothetical protein n=1 Tax=Haliangium sp. TaxID=2663208 RepID=UPI003D0BF34B
MPARRTRRRELEQRWGKEYRDDVLGDEVAAGSEIHAETLSRERGSARGCRCPRATIARLESDWN